MIVKNESKIIVRLLDSVVDIIDSWCICDTGSTDDTMAIIRGYFADKRIAGKLIQCEFKNFGYNRTYALDACKDMAKASHILLLDADMVFWKSPDLTAAQFKAMLGGSSYYLYQGDSNIRHKNIRIIKNNIGCSYHGVTHEYVNFVGDVRHGEIRSDQACINDIGDGGSKETKFTRDIELLTAALVETPNNDRYTFYLANSYRNTGKHREAIEYYKKRIAIGGWFEEVWYSYFSIGSSYKDLGDNANAIYYWMEAYAFFPKRVENLYDVIKHYRIEGKHKLAHHYHKIAMEEINGHTGEINYLFLGRAVYDYLLDLELIVFGYYYNPTGHDLGKLCMQTLSRQMPNHHVANILMNYKFYSPALCGGIHGTVCDLFPDTQYRQQFVCEDGMPYNMSTPSVCFDALTQKLYTVTRYVSYVIDEKGRYINKPHIMTKNVLSIYDTSNDADWKKTREFELLYDTQCDDHYVGQEDVRICLHNGNLCYNANRGLSAPVLQKMGAPNASDTAIVVEHGRINLATASCENSVFLRHPIHRPTEKNWVLFTDAQTNLKCIYKWSPLTIGDIVHDEFAVTHTITAVPEFFNQLRGSTNGVMVGDELWFITHLVSYEREESRDEHGNVQPNIRRYYYHCIVVLDPRTYGVIRHTRLFTFEKHRTVEYTLGFAYFKQSDSFLIGYSCLDKETKYITVPKTELTKLFI